MIPAARCLDDTSTNSNRSHVLTEGGQCKEGSSEGCHTTITEANKRARSRPPKP